MGADAARLSRTVHAQTVHATAVVVGETGVLIRGAAGSGKSTLARLLLDRAARDGYFARLVSDDRVRLVGVNGRLVAETVPQIAGLIEVRGVGIIGVPHEPAAVIGLVVDMDAVPERLPRACDKMTTVLKIDLPRIAAGRLVDLAGIINRVVVKGEMPKCGINGETMTK